MTIEQLWNLVVAMKPCYFYTCYFFPYILTTIVISSASICPSIHIPLFFTIFPEVKVSAGWPLCPRCHLCTPLYQWCPVAFYSVPNTKPHPPDCHLQLLLVLTVTSYILCMQMLPLECKMAFREKHLWEKGTRKQDLAEEYVKLWWLLKA